MAYDANAKPIAQTHLLKRMTRHAIANWQLGGDFIAVELRLWQPTLLGMRGKKPAFVVGVASA